MFGLKGYISAIPFLAILLVAVEFFSVYGCVLYLDLLDK